MRRLDLLLTPGFLLALAALVLNDAWFKWQWPGIVTGKISDFAGLYAVTLFLLAWRPRHPVPVVLCVSTAFIWWKSAGSDPVIDLWNTVGLWPVRRVIDYTDLLALSIQPLAVASAGKCTARDTAVRECPRQPGTALIKWAVACVSILAFAATSRLFVADFAAPPRYRMAASCAQLNTGSSGIRNAGEENKYEWYAAKHGSLIFSMEPTAQGEACVITLHSLSRVNSPNVERPEIQAQAIEAFEKALLEPFSYERLNR